MGLLLLAACSDATQGAGPDDQDPAELIPSVHEFLEVRLPAADDSAEVETGRVVTPVPGVAARVSAEPWHREPKYIMMRSVLMPGWGQLANGKPWKALLFAAGEGYFVYRAFHYGRDERDLRAEAGAFPEESPARAALERSADYAGDRRRDSLWWAIFTILLSMGDAYVDAHLGRNFEVEFEPQDRGVDSASGGDPLFRVGLRRRFP